MSATESLIERLDRAAKNAEETLAWLANHEDAGSTPIWEAQAKYEEDAKAIREAAAELEALRSRCERMERERDEAFEQCAKIAEIDMRSPMAIASGHKPEWYKHGLSIAKRIRNAARALQQGDGAVDGSGR